MSYSRHNPSPRYRELLRMYQEMHLEGERFQGKAAQETFDGTSLKPQLQRIRRMVHSTGAKTLLDYGSGKGNQYNPMSLSVQGEGVWDSVIDYWGVDEVVCFDPAYQPFSKLPQGRFDGVISTDMLEHCPEQDVDWIVGEMFSFAERFVFATIACYPAGKRLPNGENAHCTLRPPQWWEQVFSRAAARYPALQWEAWVLWEWVPGRRPDTRIGSAPVAPA
jgi:hypothetical protein